MSLLYRTASLLPRQSAKTLVLLPRQPAKTLILLPQQHCTRNTPCCGVRCMSVNITNVRYSPTAALTLAAAALIPFITPPLYIMYYSGVYCTNLELAHITYGAIILSFIGGVRWGLSLGHPIQRPTWRNLVYSSTLALLAWPALLLPPIPAYGLITTGLLTAGFIDIKWSGYPDWYKSLRLIFTLFAVGSVLAMLSIKIENIVLSDKERSLVGGEESSLVGGKESSLVGGEESSLVGGEESSLVGGEERSLVGGEESSLVGGEESSLVVEDLETKTAVVEDLKTKK